jgi:dsDNA-specific endonuclease/ATPase MutS2
LESDNWPYAAGLAARTTTFPGVACATFIKSEQLAKLKLDLHEIYNRGQEIDAALNHIVQEAIDKKIDLVEIIPGKGSGQLKKKVLRFLNQSHIKKLYHRVEKDDKNFGRIFIHFRF